MATVRQPAGGPMIRDEDLERAEAYTLIGHLFRAAPGEDTLALLGDFEGDGSELGRAVADLAAAARTASAAEVAAEFADLFARLEVPKELAPYASVQRTGSHYGRVYLELREDLDGLAIARRDGETEPEDHLSAICEVMAGLLTGRLGGGAEADRPGVFFRRHILPWMPAFAENLEADERARFYGAVARFARLFLKQEAVLYS